MPFEWPEHLQLTTKQRVASILWTLQQNGGEVTDEEGLVTSKLNDLARDLKVIAVPKMAPGAYAPLIGNMCGERDGSPWATNPLIERDTKGKRTYSIRLLVEDDDMPEPELAWRTTQMPVNVAEQLGFVPAGSATKSEPEEVLIDSPVETVDVGPSEVIEDIPDVPTESTTTEVEVRHDTPAALRKVMAISKIATDLMIELSEIAQPITDDAVLGRLADAMEENARLRQEIRSLKDNVETKAREVSALRHSLKITGANLERVRAAVTTNGHLKGDDFEQAALAKLMQQPPAAKSS